MTFTVISTFAMAQKMKIVSGNFDFLKDQTEVNVELIFDKNVIFQAENLTEVQYLENRKNDVLANPKKLMRIGKNGIMNGRVLRKPHICKSF